MRHVFIFSLVAAILAGGAVRADAQDGTSVGCAEVPREDALPALCVPPSSEIAAKAEPEVLVRLFVAEGTPLRIAIDQKARISYVGEAVHGKVVEPVFAFDRAVIPAGSTVSGHISKIDSIPVWLRLQAYADAKFTPFHKFEVAFDKLTLPDGKEIPIRTKASPGTAEVVHLVADANNGVPRKKNAAARAADNAKQEAKARVQGAVSGIKSPGKLRRLEDLLWAQSPYRRQYLRPGTRFNATIEEGLDFGSEFRTREELSELGGLPADNSLLHARLTSEVSSANAKRGTPVVAVLTEPVYSTDHHLLLPANTKLVGEVLEAKPARKFHHNGDLRVGFNRLETPEGVMRPMKGSLDGVEVARAAGLKLDEEGGARATDSKKRYLFTGFSVLMAAAASHPDTEHGRTDAAGDADLRAGAGASGYGISGSLITLAARSQPVSLAFAAYGASMSFYANFLSRGKDVVFVKDTPLEIGFGPPHKERPKPDATQ